MPRDESAQLGRGPTEDDPLPEDTLGAATLIRDRSPEVAPPVAGPEDVTPEAPGRYGQQLRELGRGGIGRVFIAHDRHLGRDVAIKELLAGAVGPRGLGASESRERFLREARITSRLEHPSIVPVYELGRRRDGRLYYTMRLVHGRTLAAAIASAQGRADRWALLDHFVDLAQAVAYAHSRGVIHRDIKPANVMLGPFGETVLLDWGLAKIRDARTSPADGERAVPPRLESNETLVGDVVGTPAYMSPEQARGEAASVDERSDVWSLGAVLFEILTGEAAFQETSVERTLREVTAGRVPAVEALEPRVPRDLAAIVRKAMAPAPEDRYANAEALVEDVVAFRSGRLVGAYQYRPIDLAQKLVAEHKKTAVGLLVALGSLLAATVLTLIAYQGAVEERGRAEAAERAAVEARGRAEANERTAHAHLSAALAEKARLLADELDYGGAAVYGAAALVHSPFVPTSPHADPELDRRDPGEIARARLPVRSVLYEALTHRQLEVTGRLDTGSDACAFDVVATGRRVVASTEDGDLLIIDPDSGRETGRVRGRGCAIDLFALPGGDRVAYRTRTREAWLVDLRSGDHRRIRGNEARVRRLAVAPDGQSLFLLGEDRELARLDPDTLAVEARREIDRGRSLAVAPDGGWIAVGTHSGRILLVEPVRLRVRRGLEADPGVWTLAYAPDGRTLAASGFSGRVTLFDLDEGTARTLPGDTGTYSLAFTPDGDGLYTASLGRGQLWSLEEPSLLQTFRIHPRGVAWLRAFPGGSELVATSGFGPGIHLWRRVRPGVLALEGHAPPIFAVSVAPDGRELVLIDGKGTLRWWDLASGALAATAHEDAAWSVAHVGKGRVYSINARGRVRAWTAPGVPGPVLQPESPSRVGSQGQLAAHPKRGLLAFTGPGEKVVVYDLDRNHRLGAPELDAQSAAVAFSADGRLLAASDAAGGVAVWSVDDLVRQWARPGAHEGVVSGLAFSPDGARLATSGRDGYVRLWSPTGQPLAALQAHRDWANRVAFSPDGRRLATSSDDATFRLWSVDGRHPEIELRSSEQAVAVAFLPRGDRFVVGRAGALEVLPTRIAALERSAPELLERAESAAGLTLDGIRLVPWR